METRNLAKAAAIAIAAIAITAAAIQMRDEPSPGVRDVVQAPPVPTDPLRAELVRCQALGVAGAEDSECIRAWAENRRRFLAPGARPMERVEGAEAPADDGGPVVKRTEPAETMDR